MKDFFISYNKADREMAMWIDRWLKDAGYTTHFQVADFVPGSNWAYEMVQGAESLRTIAVLSPDYLQANCTWPEMLAAFAADPKGENRKLLFARVRECELPQMLRQIVDINLIGKTGEEAKQELLDGIKASNPKLKLEEVKPLNRVISDISDIKVGPNIVTAWFRLVVNPLLISLRAERVLLMRKKWTWRPIQKELEHIKPIWTLVYFHRDSLLEFLRLHSELSALANSYDEKRKMLIESCDKLQKHVETHKSFSLLYEKAKLDASTWHMGESINKDLLDGSDAEHRKFLVQYI